MSAARFQLGNLVVIVDRNTLQLADRTETIMPLEPLAEKWRAFGFEVGLQFHQLLPGKLVHQGVLNAKPLFLRGSRSIR
mgnify:CR=1 FL=1